MDDSLQALESRLQAMVTPAERQRARCDAWQVLQLLQLQEQTRDHRLESEQDGLKASAASEVA